MGDDDDVDDDGLSLADHWALLGAAVDLVVDAIPDAEVERRLAALLAKHGHLLPPPQGSDQ